MQTLIAGLVAAFVGILVGFWLRSTSAKAEKAQAEQHNAQRNQELSSELTLARRELAQAQADSVARAGFESLAAERERNVRQLATERDDLQKALEAKSVVERGHTSTISRLEAELKSERGSSFEKLKLLTDARVVLTDQFKSLAGEILDDKSAKFTVANKENLDQILNPLRVQINDFRTKVEESQRDSLTGRIELSAELKQLKNLNERLSTEAHNLSTALRRDTREQGHWGEIILLDILENSGLRKGEHYTYQESFLEEGEDGYQERRRRTDVIVKLPEGRHLIIDSKVTLNAYNDFVGATTEELKEGPAKRLLASFRTHYTELATRNYQRLTGLQSPDFVVMFVPLEPAFMLAIQKDESLWMDAYHKGVLLSGPTTVLFVVRIVENLWRQEQQAKNVIKVMDRGEKLYEKFVGFVDDLTAVGVKISDANQSYKDAFGKLSTGRENLVRQVEMLRELGLKPKKRLKPKLLETAGLDLEEQAEISLAANAGVESEELLKGEMQINRDSIQSDS